MKVILIGLLIISLHWNVTAQPCVQPGQTPSTAFPICGTKVFQQTTVPICATHSLTVPGCSGRAKANYEDKNPYWYKFTCNQAGSLGFLISPLNQDDDYDWQLYDITGHTPDDVFTNASLIVAGNWSATYGNTGASTSGVNFIQCGSGLRDMLNTFSTMPQISEGHTYLLLVSHFTNSQSGYNLSFNGGTAIIIDTTLPELKNVEVVCGGSKIRIKLSKKIKCSSLAADGSDFAVTPGTARIMKVRGIGCENGFDTDSIELTMNSSLAPDVYSLIIKKGTDGNTLLDYCDRSLSPTADTKNFLVLPLLPTAMDSLVPPQCAPQALRLVFKKPMLCASVAANGSDFTISGTYPVSIAGATANCLPGDSISNEIIVHLTQPLYQKGDFTISLKKGSDGNTIFDECGQQTPITSLFFHVDDTVSANFSLDKRYGCLTDTIMAFHAGGNDVNSWQWYLDDGQTSTNQYPIGIYTKFGKKDIRLVVSNGFCSDSSSQTISLDNFLKADFSTYEDNCPNEPVPFTSHALGIALIHNWSFGDGGYSNLSSPEHTYSQPYNTTPYTITYTITDSIGCTNSSKKIIKVYNSCYLAVPNAFTPNGDGKNDFLRVLNAIKAEHLEFKVFNRWGELIYKTTDWKQGWDGTIKEVLQATGVYVWFLRYTDRDTKKSRTLSGTAALIR